MSDIQSILKQIAMIVNKEMDRKYRLFLFGSRAGGDYHPKADIDIGILPDQPIDPRKLADIREKIENIPTLLRIDFVDFSSVGQDFRKIAMEKTKDISS